MKKLLFSSLLLLQVSAYAKVYYFSPDDAIVSQTKTQTPYSIVESNGSLKVKFDVPSLEAKKFAIDSVSSLNFSKFKVQGVSLTDDEGEPALPYTSLIVKGYPNDIMVKWNKGKEYILENVIPTPAPKMPLRNGQEYFEDYSPNWLSYNDTDESSLVQKEFLGDFRGTPLTRVTIKLAQYSGRDQYTKVFPRAEFTLSTRTGAIEQVNSADLFKNLGKKYLILTPAAFIPSLKPFIEWKEKLGFDMEVFELEKVGNKTESIKAFIQTRYKELSGKLGYVMLVGHETMLVTEYKPTSTSAKTPSDLAYFTMGGAEDFIPDVLAGRMVVTTSADVDAQVKKILTFEQNNYADKSGYGRGMGIASEEGSSPSDEDYILEVNKAFEDTFQMEFTNYFEKEKVAIPANITSTINKGLSFITYIGHGSGTAWASLFGSNQYSTNFIKDLKPNVVNPIIIDVACQNGRFKAGQFGERFMNERIGGQPVGAVAYYGGSVNISWHPPAKMATYITKLTAENKIDEVGKAVLAGQVELSKKHTNLKEVKENLVWYHLFGDPSLQLKVSVPKAIKVTSREGILSVTDERGIALDSATVVLKNSAGKRARLMTDASGELNLENLSGEFTYTIKAKGHSTTAGKLSL